MAENWKQALKSILITDQLELRITRAPSLSNENEGIHRLAQSVSRPPEDILRVMLDTALSLCEGDTAGISVLEKSADGTELFRWIMLAGKLSQYVGGSTPRDFSPCGVTLDLGKPQLFLKPARVFTYFEKARPAIEEGLVVPFSYANRTLGTIWIVSHAEKHAFDSEDARVMESLAGFAGLGVYLMHQQGRIRLPRTDLADARAVVFRR
ncbi:MAG: GAF domain-containing protein [Akkermansiaceae bacterium]|nr:GAF domain-containing protein [Verrucomicrobiales bacterium]